MPNTKNIPIGMQRYRDKLTSLHYAANINVNAHSTMDKIKTKSTQNGTKLLADNRDDFEWNAIGAWDQNIIADKTDSPKNNNQQEDQNKTYASTLQKNAYTITQLNQRFYRMIGNQTKNYPSISLPSSNQSMRIKGSEIIYQISEKILEPTMMNQYTQQLEGVNNTNINQQKQNFIVAYKNMGSKNIPQQITNTLKNQQQQQKQIIKNNIVMEKQVYTDQSINDIFINEKTIHDNWIEDKNRLESKANTAKLTRQLLKNNNTKNMNQLNIIAQNQKQADYQQVYDSISGIQGNDWMQKNLSMVQSQTINNEKINSGNYRKQEYENNLKNPCVIFRDSMNKAEAGQQNNRQALIASNPNFQINRENYAMNQSIQQRNMIQAQQPMYEVIRNADMYVDTSATSWRSRNDINIQTSIPRIAMKNDIQVSGNQFTSTTKVDPFQIAEEIGKQITSEIESSVAGWYQ